MFFASLAVKVAKKNEHDAICPYFTVTIQRIAYYPSK